ncbi:hypothetical protein SLS55_010194 [Diplodia seriata]|uniref:Uncharacterized protein n=1 Tax=Diplodia seriata TaxID=420778 RepID=A0ABR3BY43_9PEZI
MFKFFDAMEERNRFSDIQNSKISDTDFEGHIDPFYAECRAYGRINEFHDGAVPKKYEKIIRDFSDRTPKRRKREIAAAQCYGYLHLSPEDEECLREKHGVVEWNRQENDEGKPIRALVKQLIESKEPISKKRRPNIRRMRDDLWTLHGIGVYPRDVCSRNYRDGLLLDFGQSLTVPHCAFEVLPRWQVDCEINDDMVSFDEMIEEQKDTIENKERKITGIPRVG